jgi:hypothetical protein
MANDTSKGLLIAILVISAANLLVSALQSGMLLRQPSQNMNSAAPAALPSKYTEALLTQIARRVTEPYNRGDNDALYGALDDFAKNQVTRNKLAEQVAMLKELVGNVDFASYAGFQKLPSDSGMQLYKLTYSVKLSGGKLPAGVMLITVLDRPSQPGIVGFFINGISQ